jgi:A/G-specific adenine glycosylase
VARWPTVEALAAAADEDILSEWAGLGYYARARNLIHCARQLALSGGFPTTAADLRRLPGIGAYTSAAIAAIAFGERAPAVDTNVERVIARLHGLAAPAPSDIEARMLALLPPDRSGDFLQAMMDLGATICRPRNPHCGDCPLRSICRAFASGNAETFPKPRQRAARPHRFGVAYWTQRDGQVWLTRRPAKGLLGGMAALPGSEWTDTPNHDVAAIGAVRHVFSHFSLDLQIVALSEPQAKGWWQPLYGLGDAGLPTLYVRAAKVALNARVAA